jgi:hypothetical protein
MATKRQLPSRFPAEYEAAKLRADRWYRFGMAGAILTLGSIAVGILYGPALTIAVVPAGFTLYSFARFAVRGQEAARLLRPWLQANPYEGPAPKVLGPLRAIVYTQPAIVGLVVTVIIVGAVLLAITIRHHLPT